MKHLEKQPKPPSAEESLENIALLLQQIRDRLGAIVNNTK